MYFKQFGFHENFSTSHVMICLIESIQKHADDKQITCGVFTDIEKASNTVDHTLFPDKMGCNARLGTVCTIYPWGVLLLVNCRLLSCMGLFHVFLNYINDTKLRKASLMYLKMFSILLHQQFNRKLTFLINHLKNIFFQRLSSTLSPCNSNS